MIEVMDWLKRSCRRFGAAGALAMLATTANGAECHGVIANGSEEFAFCRSIVSSYAQYDDDDEDDDEDDEDDDDEFVYDEDEGSLLVDRENCEPGKYWMMDLEDGVMLPCR